MLRTHVKKFIGQSSVLLIRPWYRPFRMSRGLFPIELFGVFASFFRILFLRNTVFQVRPTVPTFFISFLFRYSCILNLTTSNVQKKHPDIFDVFRFAARPFTFYGFSSATADRVVVGTDTALWTDRFTVGFRPGPCEPRKNTTPTFIDRGAGRMVQFLANGIIERFSLVRV